MKELKKIMRPLQFKITIERMIVCSIGGIGVSSLISAIILSLSKFTYIPNIYAVIIFICAAVLFISQLYALTKRPNLKETAEIGDSLGFKERLVTSVEILSDSENKSTPIHKIMINDTFAKAKNMKFAKDYKIKISRKLIIITALLLTVSVATGFMPVSNKSGIERQILLEQQKSHDIKKIEDIQEEIKKKLPAAEAEKVNRILERLTEDLKKSEDIDEIKKSLQKAQEELKKISKVSDLKDLKKLGENLSKNDVMKKLGESMQTGDEAGMKAAAESLRQSLKKMDEEDIKALAESLKDIAKDTQDTDGLKEQLESIANNLSTGNPESAVSSINSLMDMANAGNAGDSALQGVVNSVNTKLSSMGQSDQQNQNGQQSQDGEHRQGEGQERGQSQDQQQGQGEGQGEGQGQGQGEGQGQGRGEGHIEDEMIYLRDAQGHLDFEANIQGTQNSGGEIQQNAQKGFGDRGESVPYKDVYQEYKSEALKNLDDYDIPQGMQELIKQYFSALD